MDTLKETVLLVHKALEHGAGTTGKEIAAAIAEIAAALDAASKGVKPVAACTLTEWRAAEEAGGVVCLECGETVQALGSHALKAHGLSWTAYTERWNWWAEDNGVTLKKAGAALSAKRRDTALMIGLGAKGQQKGYVKPKKVEEAKPAAPAPFKTGKKPSDDELRAMTAQERQAYAGTLDDDDDEEIERIYRIIDEKKGIINDVNVAHQRATEELADYIAANGTLSEYGLRWVKIEDAMKAAALDREALTALLEQKLGNKYGEMFSCMHPEGFTVIQIDTGGI